MPRAPEPDPPGIPELPAGLIGRASPRAGIGYRALRRGWRIVAGLLGFRVEVTGLEHLPRDTGPEPQPRDAALRLALSRPADARLVGGYIAAGLPHRSWIDPFLLWGWLPVEPRLAFLGDARTMARSPLRRWVVRWVGGILPIPSHGGPRSFATHLAGARDLLAAGAVFCLFPESGFPAPVGTTRPISPGIGYVAIRSEAAIVPIVIGGNDLLYLGRRITVRVMPAVTWQRLAALDGKAVPEASPTPGSAEERQLAHRVADGLRAHTAEAVRRAHADVVPRPGARLRGTRLTHLFR
jgi:1-acyl-sn-glycerol-3-phosphate acyltransferase